MTNTFKPGDKVKTKGDTANALITKGKIYTVATRQSDHTYYSECIWITENDRGKIDWFLADIFELVESTPLPSYINDAVGYIMCTPDAMTPEEIVKRLNEDAQFLKSVCDRDDIEWAYDNNWRPLNDISYSHGNYRVAPKKPKILQLTSWKCELKCGVLSVGCKKFSANTVMTELVSIVKHNLTTYGSLCACRDGVKFENYLLPWADAEKLLAFLEENKV